VSLFLKEHLAGGNVLPHHEVPNEVNKDIINHIGKRETSLHCKAEAGRKIAYVLAPLDSDLENKDDDHNRYRRAKPIC